MMPRRNATILAGAALFACVAALAVLYVIPRSSVHRSPPDALAGLEMAAAPQALPPITVVDAQGRKLALSAYRGRIVILNLWATWCAPCVHELPALAQLANALGADRVAVLAVNTGQESGPATAAFLKAHRAGNLAVVRDPSLSLLQVFGAEGLPFSVLVDAQGRQIGTAVGPLDWSDPQSVAYFRELGAKPAT